MKMRYSDTIRALSALLFLSVTLTGCAGKTGENSSTPQPSKEIDVTTYYEKHNFPDDVCCKRCISSASNTTYSQLICGTNEMADERMVTDGRIDLYSCGRLLYP